MRSKKPFSAGKPIFALFMALLLASAIVPTQAQARKFKVLHTFSGKDGIGPDAQLVLDAAGNLYGTAGGGGGGSGCGNGGCGTAFKMDKTGKLLWVHSFNGANGDAPFPGLLRDASGNLYGTTIYGGTVNHYCGLGCGVAFKLDKDGKETVLHKFSADPDGYYPVGPLVEDKAGNLYGATQLGGKGGVGTVFRLDRKGKETILYNFTGGSDGCNPGAGVILDAAGNIYGTTFQGGAGFCNSGLGVVIEVDTSGKETVLHTFDGPDGANPASALLLDTSGNLYGTTENGGNLACDGGQGCGVVFELSPQSGGRWAESTLYDFCSLMNCTDGKVPREGPLARDTSGNLYGTASEGGSDLMCNGGNGCGVVFELGPSGNETVVHSFSDGTDGNAPLAGVTIDMAGRLYGAAVSGGVHRDGTVFKIVP